MPNDIARCNSTIAMPRMPESFSMASTNPLRTSGGKSTWVVSPVTIILES